MNRPSTPRARRLRIGLAALLVLVPARAAAGPPGAGRGGGDEKTEVAASLRRALASPFLQARETALRLLLRRGRTAIPSLEKLLRDPDHRVRALAARGLARLRLPAARDALLRRLAHEPDPRLVDTLAGALVAYGRTAWAVIRTRARTPAATATDRRAFRRFLWEYVVHLLHRILSENTDAGGDFKGFYDGQFAEVAAIGPEAADVLVRMILDKERFPISVRQFAIRAMAEVGRETDVAVLRQFHNALAENLGPDDAFRSNNADPEQLLMVYARRVLARLGDPEPCLRRIRRLRRNIFLLKGARDEQAGYYQYELAYEWHQMREYGKAMEEYRRYLQEYPASVLTVFNSRHYAWYNMCCIASKLGRKDEALYYLAMAFKENYTDFAWLALDRDLDNIRNLEAYKKLVAAQKAKFLPRAGKR